eukprot:scaffold112538_cov36-Phaeocystis_antarctica.AAC.1
MSQDTSDEVTMCALHFCKSSTRCWTVVCSSSSCIRLSNYFMSFHSQHTRPAVAVHGDVQRQVWRGGSREGSGRDAIVLLMLQRDCMVSVPAIRASQPSSPPPQHAPRFSLL